VPIVLHFCRIEFRHKAIAFMGLLLAVMAMWFIPGPIGMFYFMTLSNPVTGIVTCVGVHIFIGALVLYLSISLRSNPNKSLHRTRERARR
jgi:hypothetical protein